MAQQKQIKFALAICLAILTGVITGCVNEKNLYDPDLNKNTLPSGKKEFGFATRGDVKLSVNYGAPGFKTLIKVYDEKPIEGSSYTVKEGLEPIYAAYTDENGKFEGTMTIPTMTSKVYLYTCMIGLPQCVELEATASGFTYNAKQAAQVRSVGTRADANKWVDVSSYPYKAYANGGTRNDNVYSLVTWDANGIPSGDQVTTVTTVGNEAIGVISKRVTEFLVNNNATGDKNKGLLREPNQINIKTPDGAEITVTYVGSKGEYHNSFGYYYYKNESEVSGANFMTAKKYIIFPHAHKQALKAGDSVKLLYFDEKGKQQDKFPKGYTVGWFLISNGFALTNNSFVKKIDEMWFQSNFGINRNTCTSNETKDNRQFITVYDKTSKLRIVGIEDMLGPNGDDYMDLTFFVSTTPDLGNDDDLAEVPDPEPEVSTLSQSGTLAFEDNWPNKGDYDLNDVAVEYKRDVTFNGDNKATGLVETFKFIQNDNAATYSDYFAYQTDNIGTITAAEGCTVERETNSIIINGTSKANKNKIFTITRTLNGDIDKDAILNDFNPYIIVENIGKDRTEIHLPNARFTSNADQSKPFTGVDAWYIDKDGKYPFAINIPMVGFKLSDERTPIDETYPKFRTWADSNGTKDKDWYKQ